MGRAVDYHGDGCGDEAVTAEGTPDFTVHNDGASVHGGAIGESKHAGTAGP